MSQQGYPEIRNRLDNEDSLFNTRTQVFLATNALWLAAAQISNDPFVQGGITIIGLTITLFWLCCSNQSKTIILMLNSKIRNEELEKEIDENLNDISCLRPTTLLAIWLPTVILISWIAYGTWVIWIGSKAGE